MNIKGDAILSVSSTFSLFHQWATECIQAGLSAGSMLIITGTPKHLIYHRLKGGPLQGMIVLLYSTVFVCTRVKWLYLVLP